MRASLRRSCNTCVKAKHRCDLQTPQCSRCVKRNCSCVYANEPLTSSSNPKGAPLEILVESSPAVGNIGNGLALVVRSGKLTPKNLTGSLLGNAVDTSLDPFDSYPPTRLPRVHVQRLIHHFLSSIAFQYYPLDLNTVSNPFFVSWWPLALEDPALFHVSLQTASLDVEGRAQNGFPISELLMIDSVSLIRQKVKDISLAVQDETLNAVVTLAAIEHGQGNNKASEIHIDGVKRMVAVRGGIDTIKRTNPLTARMVTWVSMLVTGAPQFGIQDDYGCGSGVGPIPQWQLASAESTFHLQLFDIEPVLASMLSRLQSILHDSQPSRLKNTDLHDLTCYVIHRLLLLPAFGPTGTVPSATSECLRYALVLYMISLHGTTYYSHAELANTIRFQLKNYLNELVGKDYTFESVGLWALTVGMAATDGTACSQWFIDQAQITSIALGLYTWQEVAIRLERVLLLETGLGALMRQSWGKVLMVTR